MVGQVAVDAVGQQQIAAGERGLAAARERQPEAEAGDQGAAGEGDEKQSEQAAHGDLRRRR